MTTPSQPPPTLPTGELYLHPPHPVERPRIHTPLALPLASLILAGQWRVHTGAELDASTARWILAAWSVRHSIEPDAAGVPSLARLYCHSLGALPVPEGATCGWYRSATRPGVRRCAYSDAAAGVAGWLRCVQHVWPGLLPAMAGGDARAIVDAGMAAGEGNEDARAGYAAALEAARAGL